jgi:DNA helicase II / ATP-dependent DNA helicase PcrA
MSDRLRRTERPRRYRVHYEEELNRQQLEAVMHPGGPMLALAGAGTGKTRTLVYRVCRLIEDGTPPGKILLLTFTNKAAREMLGRVEQLVEHGSVRVTGGTFHSAGHRILRRYADLLGYSPRFSILDREDAVELMGAALADVSPECRAAARRSPGCSSTSTASSSTPAATLDEVLSQRAPQFADQDEMIAEVFKRYLERKRRADLMDFDDLLLNWLLLLSRFPRACRSCASASTTFWSTSTRTPTGCRPTSSTPCSAPSAT